jgi:hypothetical protein
MVNVTYTTGISIWSVLITQNTCFGRALASRCKDMLSWAENEMIWAVGIDRRYRVVGDDRGAEV